MQVVGVYEIDPAVGLIDADDDPYMAEEFRAHHPPPSMIPRLHCIAIQPLSHHNPTIPQEITDKIYEEMTKVTIHETCLPELYCSLADCTRPLQVAAFRVGSFGSPSPLRVAPA
jgi:hypothetical protein